MQIAYAIFFMLALFCAAGFPFFADAEKEPHEAQKITTDNPYHDAWECTPSKESWRCFEMPSLRPELYDPSLSQEQKEEALTYALGWVSLDSSSTTPLSACQGYYSQPHYFDQESYEPLNQATSKLDYNRLQYELRGTVKLKGHVEIRQPGRRLHTDEAIIFPGEGEKKIRRLEANGHIRLRQPGILLLGTQGVADLNSHQAKIDDITYLIAVKPNWLSQDALDQNFSGYAYGNASNLQQHHETLFSLENASYTTCPPTSHTWSIYAKKITLDKAAGRGYAKHTFLKVHEIPIFYLPYFSFPITQERQSGFLYGEVGFTPDSGTYLSLPYYINLAPNYDFTFTPHIYSKRSVLFQNEFRYLTRMSQGRLSASIIKFDQQYADRRYHIDWRDHTQLSHQWMLDTEYHLLSDQDFFSDFGENITTSTANTVLVPRTLKAHYQYGQLTLDTQLESYQLINPLLTLTNRPYQKLPAITSTWSSDTVFGGPLHFDIKAEGIHFHKSSQEGSTVPNGWRSHLNFGFSSPWKKSYGYLSPELRLLATSYDLKNSSNPHLHESFYQLSLDSSLYFDRSLRFKTNTYTQTIEPRLFYLYTPLKDQNHIPIFNTSLQLLNYDLLFARNRFTDIDRIGDANQIALGLKSVLKNEQDMEVFNAAIGQLFYLKDRATHLCTPEGCIAKEDPDYRRHSSDLISQISTAFSEIIQASLQLNYDTHKQVITSQLYQLGYHDRRDHHIFNIGYQEILSSPSQLSQEQLQNGDNAPSLSQITTSSSWQFVPQWRLVGKWNFSLRNSRTTDLFSGVEYSSCCWSVRFLWYRYLINTDPNNPASLNGHLTSIPMIQFEFKGLGSTNSSKLSNLEQQIPGITPFSTKN